MPVAPDNITIDFRRRFAAWVRIEPRCRRDDFARGIQARTADPLWMLARQWQMGEFQGEDAGTPIKTTLRYATQKLDHVQLGGEARQALPQDVPLEALVEQEADAVDHRERVRIGQEFERRLRARWRGAGTSGDVEALIDHLQADEETGFPCAPAVLTEELDRATQRFVAFMRGRVIDGLVVLDDALGAAGGSSAAQAVIDEVQTEIRDWHARICRQPEAARSPAWQGGKLGYGFETANATAERGLGTRLVAPDYRNGDLDWYTFSAGSHVCGAWQAPSEPKLNPVITTPTRIQVTGTSPRWWALEDSNTDFGDMDVAKTDLAKTLLMHFALVSGDDWFSVPALVPMGSLVRIEELRVRNVFGEETTVEAARRVYYEDETWSPENADARPQEAVPSDARFDLFTVTGPSSEAPGLDVRLSVTLRLEALQKEGAQLETAVGQPMMPRRLQAELAEQRNRRRRFRDFHQAPRFKLTPPRPILLVPPVAGFRQESPPLEEVRFVRDEGANMVWAVEHVVPNRLGRPVAGFDAQTERNARWRDTLQALQARLQRFLQFGAPSADEAALLEATVRDLNDHITDLSPDARPTPAPDDVLRYRLATAVPHNWIPFMPVRRGFTFGADYAAIQFRRAKLLRKADHSSMEGTATLTLAQTLALQRTMEDNPAMTLTQVATLTDQLLSAETPHPFALDDSIPSMSRLLALDEHALLFINEESIPRAGLRVQMTKQRIRWVNGSTHVWVGRKVLTGRGEGASGLRFDVTT